MKQTIIILLTLALLSGCIDPSMIPDNPPTTRPFQESISIIEQQDPSLCLSLNKEQIPLELAKKFVTNLQSDIMVYSRDVCLIYALMLPRNVNDENIIYCNYATDTIYTFLTEGSDTISAKDFCFRKAMPETLDYNKIDTECNIQKRETCNQARKHKENCLWIVTKNGDLSACEDMDNPSVKENCWKLVANINAANEMNLDGFTLRETYDKCRQIFHFRWRQKCGHYLYCN